MAQQCQGSKLVTVYRTGRSQLLLGMALVLLCLFTSLSVAQERDPVVILGPSGSEQTDVREGQERYGPIQATDTLWSIANQVRPHSSVTMHQVMAAIVQANPRAFRNGNPNELLNGFYLRIPSLQEIQMLNPESARRSIELGEAIEVQSQTLAEQRAELEARSREQTEIVSQTRRLTEQQIREVREQYEEEFVTLRDDLVRSIQNTESVMSNNDELQDRLARLEELLVSLQEGVVSASEYEAEIQEIRQQQEELRREQDVVRARSEELSTVEQLLQHPAALAALASIPALLLILLTTWLLRKRQTDLSEYTLATSDKPQAPASTGELSDEEARQALDKELLGDLEDDDGLLSDDAFDGFEDEDEGEDLDSLTDEMLVPDDTSESEEEDEFSGIQLDSDDDLDAFSELEDDDLEDTTAKTVKVQDEPEEDFFEEAESNELGQDELDKLLEGAGDDDEEETDVATDFESEPESDDVMSNDDIDDIFGDFGSDDESEPEPEPEPEAELESEVEPEPEPELEAEAEPEQEPEAESELEPESEPEPEMDPLDPDVDLEQSEIDADEDLEDELSDGDSDDVDMDSLFNELGIEDEEVALDSDDIDSLLEQAGEEEEKLPTQDESTENDTEFSFDKMKTMRLNLSMMNWSHQNLMLLMKKKVTRVWSKKMMTMMLLILRMSSRLRKRMKFQKMTGPNYRMKSRKMIR